MPDVEKLKEGGANPSPQANVPKHTNDDMLNIISNLKEQLAN